MISKNTHKNTVVMDCEVYRNYFLVAFRNVEGDRGARFFEMFAGQSLDATTIRQVLANYRIITFNGKNYDLPLLGMALNGATTEQIKITSNKIIKNNLKPWSMGLELPKCDDIDLIEVAPGIASLKLYGGRLHSRTIQDLPIAEDATISEEQRELLREYCANDLQITIDLYHHLLPQVDLREQMSDQYQIDLRSKSDAQIAEAIIKPSVEKRQGRRLVKLDPFRFTGDTFFYTPPAYINFTNKKLAAAFETIKTTPFVVGGNGAVVLPKVISELSIELAGNTYKTGIGGLHSTEKSIGHVDDVHALWDFDVTSYYPSIILAGGYSPESMSSGAFIEIYQTLVTRRIAAKSAGDKVTADALKIVINGSFGKFGSPDSVLYSPRLLIQTTITGQLALLMLIESFHHTGVEVVSANTDGVIVRNTLDQTGVRLSELVKNWETKTGFTTEATKYSAVYSRDVNNYIALKPDGYKVKGAFAPATLAKNPTNEICTRAVIAHLRTGESIVNHIVNAQDVRDFVSVRTVRGGALDGAGNYLGKVARWYYAKGETGKFTYQVNGHAVPRTTGARALMTLPDALPADIDYNRYIDEAYSILADIGFYSDIL